MPLDELFELRDELAVTAECQFRLSVHLDDSKDLLLETGRLRCGPRCEREIREHWASREPDSLAQQLCRLVSRRTRCRLDERLESIRIDLARADYELVATLTSQDAPLAERFPQGRHVHLDALRGRLGRIARPDRVDQTLGGNRPPTGEQEQCEERPLLRPAERDRLPTRFDLERAEQSELHRTSSVVGTTPRSLGPIGCRT